MKRARYGVTIIFLIAVFISSLLITKATASRAEWDMIKKLEEEEKAQPVEVIVRPKVEYKAEGLRDPFQAPIRKEARVVTEPEEIRETPLPSLIVQGIIWGGRFPQAIINNKVVKVGDTIEGARIIDINKNGITIFYENRQYNLSSPAAGVVPEEP